MGGTEGALAELKQCPEMPHFELKSGKKRPKEEERHLRANDRAFNLQFDYAQNAIKTSKYNFFTFLPLNLFEQFQRVANAYFLCLLILQLIPAISSLSWFTTVVPLVLVLAVSAAKDAIDDVNRHANDKQVNNRPVKVLVDGSLKTDRWRSIQVGDIIKLENNNFVTADLLLLSSSEPHSLTYIETMELDGETNLKVKQALTVTAEMGEDLQALSQFDGELGASPAPPPAPSLHSLLPFGALSRLTSFLWPSPHLRETLGSGVASVRPPWTGEVRCEAPNNRLDRFTGTLVFKRKKYALDNEKILLRGCTIRNTDWCFGLVIFAGPDTKLMQNSGRTAFKRTSIERLMNFLVLMIFVLLTVLCLVLAIGNGLWENRTGRAFQVYLPWARDTPSAAFSAFLMFWSYVIILNTVVPISLYVSVEIIRLGNSFYINWDRKMYHAARDMPAQARTTTLNEELGQIKYVFSDKTGTLTQNIMTFNKCSIGGKLYGSAPSPSRGPRALALTRGLSGPNGPLLAWRLGPRLPGFWATLLAFGCAACALAPLQQRLCFPPTGEAFDAEGNRVESTEKTEKVDFSSNPLADPKFVFHDHSLLRAVQAAEAPAHRFFLLLSLCHTVMPEEKQEGVLVYQAQSPDEGALVTAARNFGFVFRARTPETITVVELGETLVYELLAILDFSNVRKRMSVIVRSPRGELALYCKGADTVLFELLHPSCGPLREETTRHLEEFAGEGLRTLVAAYKHLEEDYFAAWQRRHREASVALEEREEKLSALYEEVERDLMLLGATAIEDKLQDGVPQTIEILGRAEIKIWVLTGDKQETAVNIGYSCNMLSDAMEDIFIIEGRTSQEVRQELREARQKMVPSAAFVGDSPADSLAQQPGGSKVLPEEQPNGEYGLVINGHSLALALEGALEEELLRTACLCRVVICCRVTPLQKAQVVELVKRRKEAVTLAIGDGANDVSMIKERVAMTHIVLSVLKRVFLKSSTRVRLQLTFISFGTENPISLVFLELVVSVSGRVPVVCVIPPSFRHSCSSTFALVHQELKSVPSAHIGVGIGGQEGMQAVLASDFCFAQFRYLQRLLLVHGRWSYLRMCKFLAYFFYKNFTFTLVHFWYGFFSGFSAQTVYDEWFITLYNMMYTSLPVLAMSLFDQDVDDRWSLQFPQLYVPGQQNRHFNRRAFLACLLHSVYSSLVLFFVPYGAVSDSARSDGRAIADYQSFALTAQTCLLVVVSVQIGLDTAYWTAVNQLFVWGSLATYFVITFAMYSDSTYRILTTAFPFVGAARNTLNQLSMWLSVALCVALCVLPIVGLRFLKTQLAPTLSDKVRHKVHAARRVPPPPSPKQLQLQRRASRRSGYAFSHQHGFGALITSGRNMRPKSPFAASGSFSPSSEKYTPK
ncbi:Phospholipid-transporting ATPase 3 [Varanus komodoensis]|nr:Phospholipid-transporting ATPase 3 [Varanus komodoensis]